MLYLFFTVLAFFLYLTREQWTLKPATALQCFILFSIVFYFYRWTFHWSMPEATIFDEDAPFWVRVIKDLVFLGFLAVCATHKRFRASGLLWYVIPIALWISICSYLRLLAVDDTHQVVFNWRCPIEYLPLAFLSYEEQLEKFIKFMVGCCWIVLGFLGMEAFSGRPTGFGKSGMEMRYGSIFGSPNDLGLFTVLALLAVLVFSAHLKKPMKMVLTASLSLMLLLSVSRGAMVGLIAGMVSIWPRSKRWLMVVAGVGIVIYLALVTVFRDAQFVDDLMARAWDQSANERVIEIRQVSSEVQSWNMDGVIFGTLPHIHQENFYLSILIRTGFPGLLLFLVLAASTFIKAKHPFLRSALTAFLIASCFTPYFDNFPVNVFLWLIVGLVWKLNRHPLDWPQAIAAPVPLPQSS